MDKSNNSHVADGNRIIEWVWYPGVDAVKEGEGFNYNTDYGTATAVNGRRCNYVERPSLSNSKAFAGVSARNYPASSTGQFIEINCPGSKGVKIALAVDTVIDTGLLTFVAGAAGSHRGRFYTGKYRGRGSAIPRQTVTALLEGGMTGGTISVDGTDGITVTVADSSDMAAGDTVVIVGGENDGTGVLVPGKYTISSVTDGTTIVLTATCLSTLTTGSVTLTAFVYTGNPTCQADLLEGDESGGVEFISCPNAGTDTQAYMVGGVSYVCGGITMAADSEIVFAQGTLPGETKAFICLGTLTTKDFVIDLATNGLQLDGSSALAEINAINAAADAAYLVFGGAKWHTFDVAGGATEA